MSHVAIEQTQSTCPAEILIRGNVEIGTLSFMDAVFQMQEETAYDELGDDMVEGAEAVQEAQRRAGTDLDSSVANSLFRSTSTCLQQRYLGNCAVSGNCTGREFVDSRLEKLEISRYKANQQT